MLAISSLISNPSRQILNSREENNFTTHRSVIQVTTVTCNAFTQLCSTCIIMCTKTYKCKYYVLHDSKFISSSSTKWSPWKFSIPVQKILSRGALLWLNHKHETCTANVPAHEMIKSLPIQLSCKSEAWGYYPKDEIRKLLSPHTWNVDRKNTSTIKAIQCFCMWLIKMTPRSLCRYPFDLRGSLDRCSSLRRVSLLSLGLSIS